MKETKLQWTILKIMYIKTSKNLLVFSYNIMGDRMNMNLPKVFANDNLKDIKNNETVFFNKENKIINNNTKENYNIEYKINSIFKSPKFVYKIDVKITTLTNTDIYKIIGKNNNNLITLDNKLIPISNIIDIEEL